jgi:hypothetical protein
MNRIYNITLKTTCKTEDVLARLRANREEHVKIVEEARVGYIEKAKEALRTRLADFEKGRKGASLAFNLKPPVDNTGEYDTVISMLEMHQGKTIDLNPDEVRQLVLNQWDWTREFLTSNAYYSGTARAASEALE